MNEDRIDGLLRGYLADAALDATVDAPSLDEMTLRVAARLGSRHRAGNRRMVIVLAATLLLTASLAAAVAVGTGLVPLPEIRLVPDEPTEPATAEELAGAWQPTPLVISESLRAELDRQCRSFAAFSPTQELMLVDARGRNRAVLQYAGPDGSHAVCDSPGSSTDLRVAPSSVGDPAPMAELANDEMVLLSGSGQLGGPRAAPDDPVLWEITGRAGAAIEEVVIEVDGLPRITATLENGWFAVWWPGFDTFRLVGLDANGAVIADTQFRESQED